MGKPDEDWGVMDMDEPNLHQETGPTGRGYVPEESGSPGASLDGPVPQYATAMHHTDRQGLGGTKMGATKALPPKPKQMTHDEMMAKAQAMIDKYRAKQQQMEVQGPAVVVDHDDKGMALPAWLTRYGGG